MKTYISGLVSLRNLRRVYLDIGNAYLEAFTDEKLYIVAGPEFQELEGYILIFLKALYGLKSSGKRWAEVIHGILRDMKVYPLRMTLAFGSGKHPIYKTPLDKNDHPELDTSEILEGDMAAYT